MKPIEKYGASWATGDPIRIEMACIRNGGTWVSPKTGKTCGEGLLHHYSELWKALWPYDYDTKWSRLILSEFIKGGIIGLAGPSSSEKTHSSAKCGLSLYWCFPNETTVLCSTTTRELLEMRIWGEIKKYYRAAKERAPWLAGQLTDSAQQITTDGKEVEGRDFRNGIKGLPCKKGDRWIGLGDYVGIKNNNLVLLSDEAPLMHDGFYDSIGNMRSNSLHRPFTLIASGNPKDPIDAFGRLCQPKQGWDFLDQGPKTQVWETRESGGRCIRLVGTDSPNMDYPEGAEPYKKLIGRKYINEIAETYGRESWQYECWVLARFPTQVLSRRLFTRQFCEKFGAFDEPAWDERAVIKLFALDAAYKGVGGDRCVGGEFWLGYEPGGTQTLALIGKPILVPIRNDSGELHEDQIADFVRNYCEKAGIIPAHVFYDGTGRADLTAAFMRLWSTRVNPVEFGGRPTTRPDPQDPHKTCDESYNKFVSELNFSLKACIESKQFRGMTLDIVEEAEHRGWGITGKSKIDIETKEDTKERLKRSPDLLDMCITGVEGARRLGLAIRRLGAGRPAHRSESKALRDWRDKWQKINRSQELIAT